MAIKNIGVVGGSGFIGTRIINQLIEKKYRVRVITRQAEHCKHLAILPDVEIVETDVYDQTRLDRSLPGLDAAINLVGILNERGHNGEGFRKAHVELPRKLINACHQNKIHRLLHMSALNADASAGASQYLRTKGEGENHVHAFAGNIKVTSFRPSVVFGPEDNFFNRFAEILRITPCCLPLACASSRMAPVYVGDLATSFVEALTNPASYGKRIELCGPRIYTLAELVQYTARQLKLKRKVIPLPDCLSKLQALLLEYAPGKPFSLDNYHSLQVDSVCSSVSPMKTSLESIVPWYLGNQVTEYKLSHYRQSAGRDD